MKILVTAKYVSGEAFEGGSSRFMRLVADTLIKMGHEVVCSDKPRQHVDKEYDLIICSHFMDIIKKNPAFKILISHGIIKDERMVVGADRCISISEEAAAVNSQFGVKSEVIPQPIWVDRYTKPGKELKKILIIRREPVAVDPFAFLSEKYEVRYSDIEQPIEDQIEWSDLCISLGRGALEAMAQGRLVLVADNRPYIGLAGDGYVDETNIYEIAKCNFSGRRFKYPVTKEWIEKEISKYNQDDAHFLAKYVFANHGAIKIVNKYLDNKIEPVKKNKDDVSVEFGVLVNDINRLDMVFRQSEFGPQVSAHTIKLPETACIGLNKLIEIMESNDTDIGVFAHQDMYFRSGWIKQMKEQIAKLPDSWVVAGIIGKDMDGNVCGRMHDMRIPLHFNTKHDLPHEACCFDECCIIINLKKGFRFDENMPGFDLYGTQAVCKALEMGGTAWVIDAFAEHYCMRSFSWVPDKVFENSFRWLHRRFPPDVISRIDTTVLGTDRETSQPRYDFKEEDRQAACG